MNTAELRWWKLSSVAWCAFLTWWAPDMLPLWIASVLLALKLWDLAHAEYRKFCAACDRLTAAL